MSTDRSNLSTLRMMRSALEKASRWEATRLNVFDYLDVYTTVPIADRIEHAAEVGDFVPGTPEILYLKAMAVNGFEPICTAPSTLGGRVTMWGSEGLSAYSIVRVEDGVVCDCDTYYACVSKEPTYGPRFACATHHLCACDAVGLIGGMVGLIDLWSPERVTAPWTGRDWPEALLTTAERIAEERPGVTRSDFWTPELLKLAEGRKALFADRWRAFFQMDSTREADDVLRCMIGEGKLSYVDGELVIGHGRGFSGGAHG